MAKNSREQIILKHIEKNGFMSVNDLAKLMYTSPSSIRRDLTNLEQKKLITRTYGGAVPSENISTLTPFDSRRSMNAEQKRKAAQNASFLLRDGMSVMLDGSSTAMQMLKYIKDHKKIKVFTSNVYTFLDAIDMGIDAHCLGGKPSADVATLAGDIAEEAAMRLRPDILFFSSKCVSTNGDISDPIESETALRRVMIRQANIRVFLYDSNKMGTSSLYYLCNVKDIDYSFCENTVPKA